MKNGLSISESYPCVLDGLSVMSKSVVCGKLFQI